MPILNRGCHQAKKRGKRSLVSFFQYFEVAVSVYQNEVKDLFGRFEQTEIIEHEQEKSTADAPITVEERMNLQEPVKRSCRWFQTLP